MGIETMLLSAGMSAGTAATIGTIASFAGTAFTALNQIQKGNADAATHKYNQRINEQNAEIARQKTVADVEKADRDRKIRVGANIARAGASGTGLVSYSDYLTGNAAQEELEILTLKHAGRLEELGFRNSANLDKMAAKNAKSTGMTKAGTALLKGYASF